MMIDKKYTNWMYESPSRFMLKGWVVFCGFVSVAVVLLTTIFCVAYLIDRTGCRQQAEQYRTESTYRFISGCYLLTSDNRWVQGDAYRAIQDVEITR